MDSIPKIQKYLAYGRYNQYRNEVRVTGKIDFGNQIVYQLDHTPIDLLVKDLRDEDDRTDSGEVRPFLILVLESNSRRILAWILCYDRPNRYDIGAAIRMALMNGGIPHSMWVDQGKEIIAEYIKDLARGLDFELNILEKHQPQLKGRVERFFRTLNTRLWSTLEGYVNSNTKDRNPSVRAKYSIYDVEDKLTEFIDKYHHEKHSRTKETPLEYWNKHCYTDPVDLRELDIFLMPAEKRTIQKEGIEFKYRFYWHRDIKRFVGEEVIVRSRTPYYAPDTIEVFQGDDWLFTAYASDSDTGRDLMESELGTEQFDQRDEAWQEIAKYRNIYKEASKQSNDQQQKDDLPSSDQKGRTKASDPTPPLSPGPPDKPAKSPKPGKQDFLDRMPDEW